MLQVNGNVTAEPRDERGPLLGSPEQVAADIDRAARLGVEHIYWNTDDDPLASFRCWPSFAADNRRTVRDTGIEQLERRRRRARSCRSMSRGS